MRNFNLYIGCHQYVIMLRRTNEAIFIINPSLRRSNSLPQLSCKKEREGDSLKIDMRLQCSLDLQLGNLIRSYSSSSSTQERDVGQNTAPRENNDFKSYQRNHLGSTIVIIPGHLQNKARKKNCKKKTRFLDYEDEECSSEVGRYP